jgi:hypothetical protein
MRDRVRELCAVCACLFAAASCAATPRGGEPAPTATAAPASPASEVASAADPPKRSLAQSQSVPAGSRRALLIGINEYQTLPDLRGALNDVNTLKQTLVTRMGFPEQNISVVLDAQATRAGILAALEKIAGEARPNEFVYIHYSGHGSQAQDVNGDEKDDGRDETIVPQDGRTPGIPDITDDELAAILDRIRSKDILVVLDSCHSGTATRSILGTRSVEMDTRTQIYEELDAAQPRTRAILPVEDEHVLLTAAAPNQKALDGPVDGVSHGLFSHALNKAFAAGGPDATPREILVSVRGELERVKAQLGLRNMPEPQLEGPRERLDRALVVVGATATATPAAQAQAEASDAPRLPFALVEPAGSGRVLLKNASALDAQPRSSFAIYPPGEIRFHPGAALAQALVSELRGSDALADTDPKTASIEAGSRAVVVAPPPPPRGVAVGWLGGPADRRSKIESAVAAKLPDVQWKPAGQFVRYLLELEGDTCKVFGADGVYLVSELPAGDLDALAEQLAALLSRSMTTAELLALDNPASELSLEVSVGTRLASRDKEGPSRALLVVADTTAPVYRIRKPGEARTPQNSLQLAIRASRECFLTVVDVDPEGSVNLLFPNPISESKGFHPGGRIPAGQVVLIPDSLDRGNQAGFHIDYAPPAGTDTVRGFCVTNEDTARALRTSIEQIGNRTRGIGTRGGDESPAEVLRSSFGGLSTALSAVTTRGLKLVASDAEEEVPAVTASAATAAAGGAAGSAGGQGAAGGASSSAGGAPGAASGGAAAGAGAASGAQPSGGAQPAVVASAVATAVEPEAGSFGPATDWTAASVTIHVQE